MEEKFIEGLFEIAQVCASGHVITAHSVRYPAGRKDFCNHCGSKTFRQCLVCESPIKGPIHDETSPHYSPPENCEYCGSSFPWKSRDTESRISSFAKRMDEAEKDIKDLKSQGKAISNKESLLDRAFYRSSTRWRAFNCVIVLLTMMGFALWIVLQIENDPAVPFLRKLADRWWIVTGGLVATLFLCYFILGKERASRLPAPLRFIFLQFSSKETGT